MDPHDLLKENNRLRALSNPLLLNEALLMRRRGAFKEVNEFKTGCSRTILGMAKAWFRRGQVRIDLQKWEDARHDFTKAVECGAVQSDVDKELHRLRRLERQQDAKDGKTLKHTFDPDRPSIYDTATSKGVERGQDIKEDASATATASLYFLSAWYCSALPPRCIFLHICLWPRRQWSCWQVESQYLVQSHATRRVVGQWGGAGVFSILAYSAPKINTIARGCCKANKFSDARP